MKKNLLLSVFVFSSIIISKNILHGQYGVPDPTFKIKDPSLHDSQIINGPVLDLLGLENGNIVIAGGFSFVQGFPSLGLAILDSNGVFLTEPNLGQFNGVVNSVKLLPENKLLVRGTFTAFADIPVNGLAIINLDGTLDESFILNPGTNGTVTDAVWHDNHFYLCGDFDSYNNLSVGKIIKLTAGGELDQNFQLEEDLEYTPASLSTYEGDLIVTGRFTNSATEEDKYVLRLNQFGVHDP